MSSKVLFLVVNSIFSLLVGILAGGGLWYGLKVKEVTDLRPYEKYQFEDIFSSSPQLMPWIFVCVGLLALLITVCGCCGAMMNSKPLLVTHGIFMAVVILLLVASAVTTMMVVTSQNEHFIEETMQDVFNQAKHRKYIREQFGELEQFLHCCGSTSYMDYVTDSEWEGIPKSCRDPIEDLSSSRSLRSGCIRVAQFKSNRVFLFASITAGIAAFFGLLLLILSVTSMMCSSYRHHKQVPNCHDDSTLMVKQKC